MRPRDLAANVLVVGVKVYRQDPHFDIRTKWLWSTTHVRSKSHGLDAEVTVEVANPFANQVRRDDDDGFSLNEPASPRLRQVHARHDGLASARLIGQKETQARLRQHVRVDRLVLVGEWTHGSNRQYRRADSRCGVLHPLAPKAGETLLRFSSSVILEGQRLGHSPRRNEGLLQSAFRGLDDQVSALRALRNHRHDGGKFAVHPDFVATRESAQRERWSRVNRRSELSHGPVKTALPWKVGSR